ncbi:hypothetical protein D3C73_1647550 [compost metagenome]
MQGDRLQRLAAQLLPVGSLRNAVDVVTTIETGTQLQRHAVGTVLLDDVELLTQQLQALARGE